jgi:galactokinase
MDAKGCLGSRMTGAGFGGCTVSIVKSESVKEFIEDISKVYLEIIGHSASFYICNISDGVKEI